MTFERSASWAFLRSGLSNQLTQSSLCPSNSPWLNGCSRAVMARPAKEGRLVIDEIQRCPELILPLKAVVDNDRRPGRFVLTVVKVRRDSVT